MRDYTVHLFGIMYINCQAGSERIFIPNGINPDGSIPPHYASLFIDPAVHVRNDWWPDAKLRHDLPIVDDQGKPRNVFEFRIPQPVELIVPTNGGVQIINLDSVLPKLGGPGFELNLQDPETIAQVPIGGGRLEAYAFNGGVRAVQWSFKGPDELKILAGNNRSVTVEGKPGRLGTEIVLSNTPDLLSEIRPLHEGAGHHIGHDHHYSLYAKLEKNHDASKVVFPKNPADLPFGANYLRAASEVQIQNSCVPTCC